MRVCRVSMLLAIGCATWTPVLNAAELRLRSLAPIYVDANGTALRAPEDVACAGSSILVADTGSGRLLRYTVEEQSFKPAGEIALTQVPQPIRVEIDSRGVVYALDGKSRKVARIDAGGAFERWLEPEAGSRSFVPRSLAIGRDDSLHVLDVGTARVLVLGADGELVRQIGFPEDHGFFSDLTVGTDGSVFAVDSVRRAVFSAGPDDASLALLSDSLGKDIAFPVTIATDDLGRLFVGDRNSGTIAVLGLDGSFRGKQSAMGWKAGYLRSPSGLCTDGAGHLFAADRGNNRVQPFLFVR